MINHPMQYHLQFVFEQMKIEVEVPKANDEPLLLGGPERTERGFVIHSNNHLDYAEKNQRNWRSSLRMPEISITTSHDILKAIAQGKGPEKFLVALGYVGWEAGQIEKEMADNDWLTCPVSKHLLFEVPFEKRWKAAGASLGIDMAMLSGTAGHA